MSDTHTLHYMACTAGARATGRFYFVFFLFYSGTKTLGVIFYFFYFVSFVYTLLIVYFRRGEEAVLVRR